MKFQEIDQQDLELGEFIAMFVYKGIWRNKHQELEVAIKKVTL